MDPKWYNVNEDARIWSGHADSAQKQGWLYAPAAILAIDEYKGSFQFKEYKAVDNGFGDFQADEDYPDFWIRIEDTSQKPFDPPVPVPDLVPDPIPSVDGPSDAEIGRVIRFLFGK